MKRANSRIRSNIDLEKKGHQFGELMIPWSDNAVPLGYHPIPIINIKNSHGKNILIVGGNHGDEFEGPSAIMRVSQKISLNEVNGQILFIPALSFAAVTQSSRTNPLDNRNMNRAFPGHPNGSPTEMLADYLENDLIHGFDAVIDLHSGGKASFFMPCALVQKSKSNDLFRQNLNLAKSFGIPTIWVLGENNDNRSLNSAADRAGVPMIAAELGGGGGVDPEITDLAEMGILKILNYLKIYKSTVNEAPKKFDQVELSDVSASLYAPTLGIFDRNVKAGDKVYTGQIAGWFHHITEPNRPSTRLEFKRSGVILAHSNRGMVRKGEMLTLVAEKMVTSN